jgi:hypothetical protein
VPAGDRGYLTGFVSGYWGKGMFGNFLTKIWTHLFGYILRWFNDKSIKKDTG